MTTAPTSCSRHIDGFGEVAIRPVRPAEDIDVIHDWVTRERSRFWGMLDASRERVLEIYEYLDSLATHHAYLIHRDGRPVALFQTYEPAADPVGECYDVRPGDFGIHLMIGPPDGGTERGFTAVLLDTFLAFVLADPGRRRIVAEPDARNDKAIARLTRAGFVPGPQIDLPEKRAQLLFLDRDAALG
ncbi:GNAT family N-acetyltransferase [Micromonospora sp. NPDC020750]|uniref:GNAT family N-acetyltransferase n=1 Tax=unclassified Micromonospora TaxID=2617518 RepID=UPI0037BB2DED